MSLQLTRSVLTRTNAGENGTTIRWIDIAKGIGIFLVVVGHFFPKGSPTYWVAIRSFIYEFHMPLFFLLAGYLLRDTTLNDFRHLLSKKAKRLLLPFLTAAIVITTVKLAAQQFVVLDFPVTLESLKSLLLCPLRSPAPLLWFVYTLFLMFCLFPLAYALVARKVHILFLASLVAAEFIHIDEFCASELALNFPFFVFGFAATSTRTGRLLALEPRQGLLIAALTLLLLNVPNEVFSPTLRLTSIAQGLAGSLVVIYVAKLIEHMSFAGVIERLGQLSMGIYLFPTIFEGVTKVLLGKLLEPMLGLDAAFPIIALVSIFFGLTIPALVEQHVLRRFRITRFYVLGIPASR